METVKFTGSTSAHATAEVSAVEPDKKGYAPSAALTEVRAKVAHLHDQKSNLRGILGLAADWFWVLFCMFIIHVLMSSSLPIALLVVGIVLCQILIGSRQRAFVNILHDASHSTWFSTAAWNERLQCFFAFPVLRTLAEYRKWHFLHHRHLNTALDPENDYRTRWLLNDTKSNIYMIFLVRPLIGYYTYDFIRYTFLGFFTGVSKEKYLFWAVVLAVVHFTGAWFFFFVAYIFPLFVFYPLFALVAESSEHTGTDKILDTDSVEVKTYKQAVRSTRTRLYTGFWNWLLHPHGDNYHIEHHFMAGIPSNCLHEVHTALKEANISLITSESIEETLRQMSCGKGFDN
jgi:fatty acid desaturase